MSVGRESPKSEVPEEEDEHETRQKAAERKRKKEKQRRSDLSSAFDELAAFMVEVEPKCLSAVGSGGSDYLGSDVKKKRRKASQSGDDADDDDQQESSGRITRLDIIGHALRIMKRLHYENEQNKRLLELTSARRTIGQVRVPELSTIYVMNEILSTHFLLVLCGINN